MYIIRLLTLLLCITSPLLANAWWGSSEEQSILRGTRGAMEAIDLPLQVATERAEDLYENTGGSDLSAYLEILSSSTANQYVQTINICPKYWIQTVFANGRFDSTAISGTATIPLPEILWGKSIYFIPVMDENNYRITTWECITNTYIDNSVFQGDSRAGTNMDESASIGTRATIAKYSSHPIIQKCIYLSGSQWTDLTSTDVKGVCAVEEEPAEETCLETGCPSGQYCDGESGSCMVKLGAAQLCSDPQQCYSSQCLGGFCGLSGVGEPCGLDTDCDLGLCLGNTCSGPF